MSGTLPNIIICEQRFPHVSITVWTAVNVSCSDSSSTAMTHKTLILFFKNTAFESCYSINNSQLDSIKQYWYKSAMEYTEMTMTHVYHKTWTTIDTAATYLTDQLIIWQSKLHVQCDNVSKFVVWLTAFLSQMHWHKETNDWLHISHK